MDELINTNTIVEDEIYKLFKDSVICPICKSILINPVLCLKCQDSFCQKCIDDFSENENKEKCPNKCSDPNYQKSIGKNDILSKLKFKCKKCGGEYYYHEIKKHNEICNSSINSLNDANKRNKIKRITSEEVSQIKKSGQEVAYISGKKYFSYIYNFLYNHSDSFGMFRRWQNKFNRNVRKKN